MPDVFLYPGEANPNDVKLRDPTTSGSVAVTGTATWEQAAGSWDAAAVERLTATAEWVQETAAWGAAGSESLLATATFIQETAAWSATGTEAFEATAAFSQAPGAWQATAAVEFTAVGEWIQDAASWQASEDQTITATASWEQAAAAWSADGSATVSVDGPPRHGMRLGAATVIAEAGRRRRRITARASFTAPPATWAAVGHVGNDDELAMLLLLEAL